MNNNKITVLAIETSCDETAAAILVSPKNINNLKIATPKIKSNIIYSQLALHQRTKGIVPEVASRAHSEKIILVIKKVIEKARIELKDIDIIAVTVGPGLIGSLLVGVDTAKTLAYVLDKPIIPIDHIEAHIYASFINEPDLAASCEVSGRRSFLSCSSAASIGLHPRGKPRSIQAKSNKTKKTEIFPAIALVVSGGHTSILLMRGHGDYKLLGATIDDAAGEAFDKVAKILNLPYPGGPNISLEAKKGKRSKQKQKIEFPRPMIDSDNLDFSFSGLKTAVLYKIRDLGPKGFRLLRPELAFQFQKAIIEVLVEKVTKAARKYGARSVILGGGVVANEQLRLEMRKKIKKIRPKIKLFIPDFKFCTDNAVIVGVCAYYRYLKNKNCLRNYKLVKVDLNPKL
ncbi:MAG: tRNA (adenosine(37)-N6)-threonylcarbamoyltransferase complex transferase subunit TsaD [Candidatus Berkelbacteria bacterium]|nr:tRNA (adenosine(37)-N6)-threonylcarbamoyltransferase complex transferase subunit TsaD [Candidatus Berkelbacteria bacterium]